MNYVAKTIVNGKLIETTEYVSHSHDDGRKEGDKNMKAQYGIPRCMCWSPRPLKRELNPS